MSEENIVSCLTEKELDGFSQIVTNVLKDICIFSDKYNYDRNNMFQHFANRLTIMSEITNIEHFEAKESEE